MPPYNAKRKKPRVNGASGKNQNDMRILPFKSKIVPLTSDQQLAAIQSWIRVASDEVAAARWRIANGVAADARVGVLSIQREMWDEIFSADLALGTAGLCARELWQELHADGFKVAR